MNKTKKFATTESNGANWGRKRFHRMALDREFEEIVPSTVPKKPKKDIFEARTISIGGKQNT
jgi:hypothetical protein